MIVVLVDWYWLIGKQVGVRRQLCFALSGQTFAVSDETDTNTDADQGKMGLGGAGWAARANPRESRNDRRRYFLQALSMC